jgi:hypothetical protein
MGPFGQFQGPVVSILNAKTAKVFTLHDKYHLELNFQAYNILNNSSAVSTNYLISPTTFNVVTSIVSQRQPCSDTFTAKTKTNFARRAMDTGRDS